MEAARLEHLSVLLEDADYLVLDKHWDLRIDSTRRRETLTVQQQLRHRYPQLLDPSTRHGFRFCHQLDYATSGALCVALSRQAAGGAFRAFSQRRVAKAYLALVRGHVKEEHMTIDYAIGKDTREGQTHMMCVEATPGRTHQLRVHCDAVGHAIVGDYTYSLRADTAPYRTMLHAALLRMPLGERTVQAEAPDPFVPDVDPSWCPEQTLRSVDEALAEVVRKAVATEARLATEEAEAELARRRMASTRSARPVSEAATEGLQRWLQEWPADL
ncbi:RNA pseudouridylate synthase domain-containing protein 1-like isoform X2 [Lethenteron reissneri]|uniref:RNA pseudouridylate synthase domain-containing protein 1-like isoform X2 n=1 Tax=Lethenteron reissneri TaxID=7753 RepID=UPI002AB6205C|nr:RNA pseudouridylate synthase domain-containing protein 1-like isoform X2 [Lethenteron reissneri]XP_061405643.1 RNA pseudouridylate synthase domain-containing protein 1-like isoform X2 [Lethenteron reissneri]